MPYENSFNYAKEILAKNFGQPFRLMSVDYTAQDQTPVELIDQIMYKVEVAGPKLVQTPLPNASYYCVHGNYNAINEGNILVPLRSDSNTPITTFVSKSPFEEMTSFRTSRICDIMCGEEVIYSNCYFEYATTDNYPGNPIHRVLAADRVPENKALMRRRVMRSTEFDTEGLLLRETDGSVQVYWEIEQVTEVGTIMSLTIKLSKIQ